jgi:hypothetical protein
VPGIGIVERLGESSKPFCGDDLGSGAVHFSTLLAWRPYGLRQYEDLSLAAVDDASEVGRRVSIDARVHADRSYPCGTPGLVAQFESRWLRRRVRALVVS